MDKKIYIKDGNKQTSLKELIAYLYTNDSGDRQNHARETYSDEACTIRECHSARRSLEDLLGIANTYFPGTDEKSLMSTLKELNMRFWFCGDIDKFVFMGYNEGHPINAENFYLHMETEDEREYAGDTYTLDDLINFNQQITQNA